MVRSVYILLGHPVFNFYSFSKFQGEDVDTAAKFAALEKQVADKTAVNLDLPIIARAA